MNKEQLERIQTVNRRINWRENIIMVPALIGPIRYASSKDQYPNKAHYKNLKKIRWEYMIPWRRSHISMERVVWYIEKKTGCKVYAIRLFENYGPELAERKDGRLFFVYPHYYDIFLDETDRHKADQLMLEY